MKALSVKQPWAYLLFGPKDIENRNWAVGRSPHHGPYQSQQANFSLALPSRIYIHAGKSKDEMTKETIAFILRRLDEKEAAYFMIHYEKLYFGAIIGEVDIIACVTESPSPWFTGKYGFVRTNPKLYKVPVYCPGQLGFFEVGAEVEYRIKMQNTEASR